MYESFLLLDKKIARYFHELAEKTKEYPLDYGEMRRLRSELQELCGLKEIEALNVLTGHNVDFYISIYTGYYNPAPMLDDKTCLNVQKNAHMIKLLTVSEAHPEEM